MGITDLPPLRSQEEINREMQYGEPSQKWQWAAVFILAGLCLGVFGIADWGWSHLQDEIAERVGYEG